MSDAEFVQQRAYIYEYSLEEIEFLNRQKEDTSEEDNEYQPGIIVIDIFGE